MGIDINIINPSRGGSPAESEGRYDKLRIY